MKSYPSKQCTSEQVSRIIRNALKIEDPEGICYRELIETGKEMGLDQNTLAAAIEAEECKTERYRSLQRCKAGFNWHLYCYLVVNLTLVVINALVPGLWWFQWSVLGWGIGLAFHYGAVNAPKAGCPRTDLLGSTR
jgi:hypothetical protein